MKNIEFWKMQLQYAELEKGKLKNLIQANMSYLLNRKNSKASTKELRSKNLKFVNKLNQINTTKIPYFNSMIEKLSKDLE